jgi:hypothetical protein
MNQNTVIGSIIVIILVVIGVWYFTFSSMSTGTHATTTTQATPGTSGTNKPVSTNTFKSIFTQSGNNECTFEQVGTASRSSNVVYIADGKMRGEFRTTAASGAVNANLMIYDGGYLYVWQEGKTIGTKTLLKSLEDLPQAIPQDLDSGAIFGSSVDSVSWDCHSWNKDPKMLVVPTYVKFTSK